MDIMKQSILDFPKQFSWNPNIENKARLKRAHHIIIAGMGGSALPGDLLKLSLPKRLITIHRNYGLPNSAHAKNTLLIAVSYSGNTEETIDAMQTALKKKIPTAAVTTGGKLLKLAQQARVPYIQIPALHIQPRMATGLMIQALSALLNERTIARTLEDTTFNARKLETRGKKLAEYLKGKIPVVYASEQNAILAMMWKIKFNETGKIPAFYNVLPELNHNEMTGFDWNARTKHFSDAVALILLADTKDDARIQKRMRMLKKILTLKKLRVGTIDFSSSSPVSIFETILLGDWTAYHIARLYHSNPNTVPLVEKFKSLIR
jgi:glucose/mannose-6-phosphate isomerase